MLNDYYTDSAELQSVTLTDGSAGAKNESWSKTKDVAGKFVPLSGYKRYTEQRKGAEITAKFICGYDSSITDKQRMIIGGITYEIGFVKDPNNLHDHLEIDLSVKK